MNRAVKHDERQDVGWLHAKRTARSAPRLHTGDELAEKLHRSLGSSRATRHNRSGKCAAESETMPDW
jgi:hypothetical protein